MGAGADSWGTADSGHFSYKALTGDGATVRAGEPLYRIDPAQYRAQLNSAIAAERKGRSQPRRHARAGAALPGPAVFQRRQQAGLRQRGGRRRTGRGRRGVGQGSRRAGVFEPRLYAGRHAHRGPHQHVARHPGRLRADSLAAPACQPHVTLTLEDGSAYPLPGRLEFSGTTVDPGTGTVKLRAVFPNPKGLLLPGMYVRARVEQGKDDALLVPAKAVALASNQP